MKTIMIACRTIERELKKAIQDTGVSYPCTWLESGLHNYPEKLRESLQKSLDEVSSDTDRVILAFGYCGNAVNGLRTGNFQLILPRVDDCITLMLGSFKKRQEISAEAASYFLTKGWLEGERNIWAEYLYTREKYGERKAKIIFRSLLSNYKRLAVVDTKAYSLTDILPETRHIAHELNLNHEVIQGNDSFIRQLLTGPWLPERFLVTEPNHAISNRDLMTFG